MKHGVIVDLETTGFDATRDEIIEVGLLEFCCDDQYKNPSITNLYSGLQQASKPLSQEIQNITGLSDGVLKGRSVEWDYANTFLKNADFLVAHNMNFDRGFLTACEHVDNASIDKPWACSQRHIDWKRHSPGKSAALNYLAADHGFVNPFAHRALFDCATTYRLIAPHVEEMIFRSQQKEFLVSATFAPFEKKDLLKERRYRWDSEKRVWSKVLTESDLSDEREFLASHIYEGEAKHSEVPLSDM